MTRPESAAEKLTTKCWHFSIEVIYCIIMYLYVMFLWQVSSASARRVATGALAVCVEGGDTSSSSILDGEVKDGS